MARKNLEKLISESNSYDKESLYVIEALKIADKDISQINDMKSTSGWKIIDKGIRNELKNRIKELIKDDNKIQVLIALLTIADTKSREKELETAIESILPES